MDNRSALLHHALALFAARGYDGVGVQEVVVAAGVTKPTLYHYFGSKLGLFETLVREGFAPLLDQLDRVEVVNGDVAETLRRITQVYFAFAQREPVRYRMLLAMTLAPPASEAGEVIRTISAAQRQRIEGMFRGFADYNGNLRGRERLYAASFTGMLNTYITLALSNELTLDTTTVHRAVQLFVYGIYS